MFTFPPLKELLFTINRKDGYYPLDCVTNTHDFEIVITSPSNSVNDFKPLEFVVDIRNYDSSSYIGIDPGREYH